MTRSLSTADDETTTPLSARSVVASTLLGIDPPRLPVQVLVRCGELFGINQGTTRTAISRMVRAGELVPATDNSAYQLAGRLVERQARQSESRALAPTVWDGSWAQAVVVAPARSAAERSALRGAMDTLHVAELREGVWLRPDNLDHARHPGATAVVARQCRWFRTRPDDDPAALAGELWDTAAWAHEAESFVDRLAALAPHLWAQRADALAEGFLLSAAALRHLLADPLLPAELLGPDWPGATLRAVYDDYDVAFKAAWAAWFVEQLAGS